MPGTHMLHVTRSYCFLKLRALDVCLLCVDQTLRPGHDLVSAFVTLEKYHLESQEIALLTPAPLPN